MGLNASAGLTKAPNRLWEHRQVRACRRSRTSLSAVLCWSAALTAAGLLTGCFPTSEERPADSDPSLGEGNAAWKPESTTSPTGTTVVSGEEVEDIVPGGQAIPPYAVVDEVCGGQRLGDNYPRRFETPMFRDIDVSGEDHWLVDGSHAWRLRQDPSTGEYSRVGLHPIPGHPIAVRVVGNRLFVAAVDAGLMVYWLNASGALDHEKAPDVLFHGPTARAMDVDGNNRAIYVALGDRGVGIVALDEAGHISASATYPAGPFAAAVSANTSGVHVASCDRIYELTAPGPGTYAGADAWVNGHTLRFNAPVPFGSAKGIASSGSQLYVAAGVALLAFHLALQGNGLPGYIGHYTDDAPGFYVNAVTTFSNIIYVAAGDESVRTLAGSEFSSIPPRSVNWTSPNPKLNSPESVVVSQPQELITIPPSQSGSWPNDPIQVQVFNHTLFALGNFRWVGERTAFAFDLTQPLFPSPRPSFAQPNALRSAVVAAGQLWGQTSENGFTLRPTFAESSDEDEWLLPGPVVRAVTTPQGHYFLLEDGRLFWQQAHDSSSSLQQVLPRSVDASDFAFNSDLLFVADAHSNAILIVERSTNRLLGAAMAPSPWMGHATLHATDSALYAYDSISGGVYAWDLSPHGVATLRAETFAGLCEARDFLGFYHGQPSARTKWFENPDGIWVFCPQGPSGKSALYRVASAEGSLLPLAHAVPLPSGQYTDALALGASVVLTQFQNTSYRSRLVRVHLESGKALESPEWSGRANAVVAYANGFVVVDGDRGWLDFTDELQPDAITAQALGQ